MGIFRTWICCRTSDRSAVSPSVDLKSGEVEGEALDQDMLCSYSYDHF